MHVDPYRTSSIFLPKSHAQPPNSSGLVLERELKDPANLLPHTKLATQLLQNSGFNQQGKWKSSYKGKEVLTQHFEQLVLHFKNKEDTRRLGKRPTKLKVSSHAITTSGVDFFEDAPFECMFAK